MTMEVKKASDSTFTSVVDKKHTVRNKLKNKNYCHGPIIVKRREFLRERKLLLTQTPHVHVFTLNLFSINLFSISKTNFHNRL